MTDGGLEESSSRRQDPLSWFARHWGKAALLGVAVLAATWFMWPQPAEPPPSPITAAVTRGDIESTAPASGVLEAASWVDVGAQVSGQLQVLHVKLGDVVAEGDLLAEVDDFIQRTRVESARASLEELETETESIEAGLGLARSQVARQERMMEAKATTEVEYDSAVVELTRTETGLARHMLGIERARASLEEAEAMLNFTRITAPASGTVVEVLAQEGQTLNATQVTPVVLRIGDLTKIRVIAKITEADVGRMTPGMEAYFTTLSGGSRRWSTHLQEISPLPAGTGSAGGARPGSLAHFDGLLTVDNRDGSLLPGMSAKVFFLVHAARDVLKVPLGAVTLESGAGPTSAATQFAFSTPADANPPSAGGAIRQGSTPSHDQTSRERDATVQVVGQDGEIEARKVRVGFDNGVEAEVLAGLTEGELVVSGITQPPMPDQQFGRGYYFGF